MPGALERVRPLLEAMGKTIVHEGGPGAGQHTKMCNQIVIAGTMIGVCESLLYGARAGLDLNTMLQSIRGGAAGCWTLENLAPRVLNGNFDPGFMVEHFIKDMGIALDEAARMQLALPGLALVRQLYLATAAQGHARVGTHALYLALRQLSGAERWGRLQAPGSRLRTLPSRLGPACLPSGAICSGAWSLVLAAPRVRLDEIRLVVLRLRIHAADEVQQLHFPELDRVALRLQRDRALR